MSMTPLTGTSVPQFGAIDPQALLGDLNEIKKGAKQSIQEALTMLGTVLSGRSTHASGAQQLEAPASSLMQNVGDLTLRIALLQDTLDQLMQQVSKEEIKGRMNELHKQNKEQLEKMQDQIKEAAEAAKKNAEAKKKGNIFEAVSNWFQAAVSFVSAVFTAVTAVGYLFTNPVAAVGLFAASAAMFAAGVCQTVLAIDATMRAAGQEGFLSDKQKSNLQLAAEICGYVALGASLLSGVAVLLKGVQMATAMAVGQMGKLAVQQAVKSSMTQALKTFFTDGIARSLVKDAMKEAVRQLSGKAANQALNGAAKAAAQEIVTMLKPYVQLGMRTAVISAVNQAGLKISQGVVEQKVADLQELAAEAKKNAEQAEAATKAMEATIQVLRKMIAQLQDELSQMMEQAMETMGVLFRAVDDTADSMTRLQQMQSA